MPGSTTRKTPLRLVYRVPLLLLHFFIGLPITLLAHLPGIRDLPLGRRTLSERVLNGFMTMVCMIFGIRRRVRGRVADAPVLVVANHMTWVDIPVLHGAAAMSFVAKAEIADWPLVGFMARVGGTEFHARGSSTGSSETTRVMRERLASGHRVAVFPEGGILEGQGIKRFHARLFKAAVDADSPIQPTMIRYLREGRINPDVYFRANESMLANFSRLLAYPPSEVEVAFLEPFEVADQSRKELAARAQAAVEAAYANDLAPGPS